MTQRITLQNLEILAESRNHIAIDLPNYKNVKSPITLYCQTCGEEWTTTVQSYKNAK